MQTDETALWFKKHSKTFTSVSDELFDQVLGNLQLFLTTNSRAKADEIRDSIAKEQGVDPAMLGALIAWIATIAQNVVHIGEQAARSEALSLLDPSAGSDIFQQRLEKVVKLAKAKANEIRSTLRRVSAVKGLLPYFDSINATVELRAVLDGDSTELGHLGRREAKIVGMEPIASVSIVLDSGFPGEMTFQAGRAEIERILASTAELLDRMDQLQKFAQDANR